MNTNQLSQIVRRECRYCLSDDKIEKLIDPCQCEGTMKYVHQECLEDWIKNGNRVVHEKVNDQQVKVYLTVCEICKYEMKYTKSYKNNLLLSLFKMIKSIFSNMRNGLMLFFHSVIIFFFIKRLKLFKEELTKMFKKSFSLFNSSFYINLTHNFTVLVSILMGIIDIYMFYSELYISKRKCLINFLPKGGKK